MVLEWSLGLGQVDMAKAWKWQLELRLDAVTRSRLDLDTGYGSDLAFGRIG